MVISRAYGDIWKQTEAVILQAGQAPRLKFRNLQWGTQLHIRSFKLRCWCCRSQWPRGLRHELSYPRSNTEIVGSNLTGGMDVCVSSVCT
jgi:hypothetical protein